MKQQTAVESPKPEPEAPPQTLFRLHERENLLPIGVVSSGGARARAFDFKEWKGKDERAIGEEREANRDMTPGELVTVVLAHFLSRWGDNAQFQALNKGERKLAISQSFAADVYHAWIQLRRRVLGDNLPLNVECPFCRRSFSYGVRLGTIEEEILPDGKPLEWPVALEDGVQFHGALRKVLTMAPLRWYPYEAMGRGGAGFVADSRINLLSGSIVGLDGVKGAVSLPLEVLDEMSKRDFETASAEVDSRQPGPAFSVEVPCPSPICKRTMYRLIPWVYDSFFSMRGSSRGAPGGSA